MQGPNSTPSIFEEESQQETHTRRGWSLHRKTILIVGLAISVIGLYFLLPFVVVSFAVQPVKVEGAAMSPTLSSGDRIFIGKRIGELKRGDIVVFRYPEDTTNSFIKDHRFTRRKDSHGW